MSKLDQNEQTQHGSGSSGCYVPPALPRYESGTLREAKCPLCRDGTLLPSGANWELFVCQSCKKEVDRVSWLEGEIERLQRTVDEYAERLICEEDTSRQLRKHLHLAVRKLGELRGSTVEVSNLPKLKPSPQNNVGDV